MDFALFFFQEFTHKKEKKEWKFHAEMSMRLSLESRYLYQHLSTRQDERRMKNSPQNALYHVRRIQSENENGRGFRHPFTSGTIASEDEWIDKLGRLLMPKPNVQFFFQLHCLLLIRETLKLNFLGVKPFEFPDIFFLISSLGLKSTFPLFSLGVDVRQAAMHQCTRRSRFASSPH